MADKNLTSLLRRLQNVSDEHLKCGLKENQLEISEGKYSNAFSCYGVAGSIIKAAPGALGIPEEMPRKNSAAIQVVASTVFEAYTALVYMRSEHLERGLDKVADDSPLAPFRDAFRLGCQKRGDDSLVQHLRNALCHGTFDFDDNDPKIHFEDRGWELTVPYQDLIDLCLQVFRLYSRAFEIDHPKFRLPDKPN